MLTTQVKLPTIAPLGDPVIYRGLGLTPAPMIPVLSRYHQPVIWGLTYLTLGHDENHHSTAVLSSADSIQKNAERVQKDYKSPLKRLFAGKNAQDTAEGAMLRLLAQKSLSQKLQGSLDLDELVDETLLVANITAVSDPRPLIDAKIISYDAYFYHDIHEVESGQSHELHKNKKEGQITPHKNVLIACGRSWDARYVVDLLPESVLNKYKKIFANEYTNKDDLYHTRHDDVTLYNANIFQTKVSNSLEYHLASHIVTWNDMTRFDMHQVYDKVNEDFLAYQEILQEPGKDKYHDVSSIITKIEILDNLRPELRQHGIYDVQEMKEHAPMLREAVRQVLQQTYLNFKDNDKRLDFQKNLHLGFAVIRQNIKLPEIGHQSTVNMYKPLESDALVKEEERQISTERHLR